jgi:hypothetical protein
MTTLSEAIRLYLDHRKPPSWQVAEVARFRARLEEILESNFRMMAFFQSGSFRHGTAISPYSDVDYIARIHFEERPTSSATALQRLRAVFERELWEASELRVDRPTVTIRFPGVVTRYEITPAYLERTVGADQVLVIPAALGGWQEASPEAHRKFIREMNAKHSGSVRQLARLLKAWKYEHGVAISSFYLEMRVAEAGRVSDSMWSLYTLRDVVAKLISTDLAAMNDPTRLVHRIVAVTSETNRRSSISALRALQRDIAGALSEDKPTGSRWEYNQRLQSIWGDQFPYTDPDTA